MAAGWYGDRDGDGIVTQIGLAFDGIDQSNTPIGMVASLKADVKSHDNICNHCDYRRRGCQDGGPNLIRCMSYSRPDGASVIFTLRP